MPEPPATPARQPWGPLALAGCLLAIPIVTALAPPGPVWRAATGPHAMVLWAIACAAGGLHLLVTLRPESLASPMQRRALWAAALLAHAGLLVQRPLFSNDLYRYLLDGRLAAHGLSPFAYAPNSPKIRDLAEPLLPAINHPEMVTIYPPGAQALFAGVALVGGGVLLLKLLLFALTVAAAAVLQRALRAERSPHAPHGALLLLSHPLVLVAVSANGHVDAVGLLAMALAAWLLQRRRLLAAAGALALGAAIKLFPAGLALAAWPRFGWRTAAVGALVVGALLGATYLPLLAGPLPVGSLGAYSARWEYNAGPWRVLRGGADVGLRIAGVPEVIRVPLERIPAPLRPAPRPVAGHDDPAFSLGRTQLAWWIARGIALLLLAGVLAVLIRRRAGPRVASRTLLLALFLTSPTVHPWYLLWLLPIGLHSNHRPTLLFCALAPVAFAGPALEAAGLGWQDPLWMALAVHVPVLSALGLQAMKRAGDTPHCHGGRGSRSPDRREA